MQMLRHLAGLSQSLISLVAGPILTKEGGKEGWVTGFVGSGKKRVGHIAENCSSEQRLCYNCRQPGHESAACPQPRSVAAKQCYSCGGVGHIQAECPSLKQNSGQKCYSSSILIFVSSDKQNCGRYGHFARSCPNGAFGGRPAPPGRTLASTLPAIKCYRCGGPNHMARDCLAAPGTTVADTGAPVGNPNKNKTCYKCQQEGHIARDCPENADYAA
ncbi:hypothetical protein OH76DRAFT_1415862 [Lentinus brumalis]|uniref:CCHC-type domain-containing protein n=1 Tax=Lentinus brumalis TaxID=2498619 RepID=A0A371DMK8_9APHY|nr:hypothetical protein OH76DRAFT_1415862 [Polyporus brumalis]